MPSTKFSVSVPAELLVRADRLLARPGEGRSGMIARVLHDAVSAAEEAEIDAEYARAYADAGIAVDDEEARARTAFMRAGIRGMTDRISNE